MGKTFFNDKKAGIYVPCCVLLFLVSFTTAELDTDVPMGVAAIPSGTFKEEWSTNKVEGCTGGGNGEVVTAKSAGELSGYLKGDTPMYIQVEGSISGNFNIGSNKTIIGMGSGATVRGGFSMGRVSNIIIRNFAISGGIDALGVNGAHNVWIDHCDLSACGDGLCDIKSGSDQITLSWTRLSKHRKTMLINSGSLKPGDAGRLHITLHHLFFDGTNSRNPRAGVGQVHILNCYYVGVGYGVHTYCEVEVTVEGCYFKNTNDAISQHKPEFSGTRHSGFNMNWDGHVKMIDNVFDNAKYDMKDETDTSRIFQIDNYYMYDWIKHAAKDVPDIVGTDSGAGTGSEWSKLGPLPIPGQGVVNVSRNPTLKWTKVGSQASNKVYFGKTNPPPEVKTVNGYSYQPGNLEEGTVYYWKINDGKVWKFRTEGKLAPVYRKNVIASKKVSVKSPKIQKGIYTKSNFFVGVGKNENEKTQLYDLRGRELLNQNSQQTKIKK
jgi:pectate lyase